MPRDYGLDTKIEALNLLDEYDGDFQLVKERLRIPVKTLRGWRAVQEELRQRYEDGQYRHFANVRLELLKDMLESSRDLMKKIRADSHEEASASQRAYTLTTLLNHANRLEEAFEDLAADEDSEEETPNRIEFVYDNKVHDAPPWAERNPEERRPLQSVSVREALGQVGIGQNRNPDGGASGTQALLVDRAHVSDGEPDLARPGKERKAGRRRENKRNRKAD